MVTQKELIEIRNNLNTSFSTFCTRYSIVRFVNRTMAANYTFSGYFTDERCEFVYNEAVKHINNEIKTKYDEIITQIIEYANKIEETFAEETSSFTTNTNSTIKNVALGAGAGLGAALILGGPVGWAIGIAAGAAAIFSSSQKHKELIDAIEQMANKLNGEVISKLKQILNVYIVEESLFLLPANSSPDIEHFDVTKLTKEQIEIKRFLEKRKIKYLVHFTDESRLSSIKEHGICSIMEGKKRGIKINQNDNNISANIASFYMKSNIDDYISLTITTINEDVLAAYKARKNILKMKKIIIDADILWKEIKRDRIYCDMNASSKSLSCGNDLKSLEAMFAPIVVQEKYNSDPIIFEREDKPDNVPTHRQAEILFQGRVDPKYFVNYNELFNNDVIDKKDDVDLFINNNKNYCDEDLPF